MTSVQLIRRFDVKYLLNMVANGSSSFTPCIAPPSVPFPVLQKIMPALQTDHLWGIYTLASVQIVSYRDLELYLIRHNLV